MSSSYVSWILWSTRNTVVNKAQGENSVNKSNIPKCGSAVSLFLRYFIVAFTQQFCCSSFHGVPMAHIFSFSFPWFLVAWYPTSFLNILYSKFLLCCFLFWQYVCRCVCWVWLLFPHFLLVFSNFAHYTVVISCTSTSWISIQNQLSSKFFFLPIFSYCLLTLSMMEMTGNCWFSYSLDT